MDRVTSGGTSGMAELERLRAALADGGISLTWVFTGDSITQGALHTRGGRSYVEHFAERIRHELHRGRDIVINSGVSGERAGGVANDFEWRVDRFRPDVVSIMLGTNDCADGAAGRGPFREALNRIVAEARLAPAIPILHTPPGILVAENPLRADVPAYVEIVRELARHDDVMLVDHFARWTREAPDDERLATLLGDPFHPNAAGHWLMAVELFSVLGIADEQAPLWQAMKS